MKKLFYIALIALCLAGCNSKLDPQNPEIKLSEEHGKMLNLIVNLAQWAYKDWNIEYDTSSDNYLSHIYYSNLDTKEAESIQIRHIKYCNGVITDIFFYSYENGVTYKFTSLNQHIRWTNSKVYVRGGGSGKKYSYSLSNPNSLKTNYEHAFANEITKVDDSTYLYRKYAPNSMNMLFANAFDGDNYIEFDVLDEGEHHFDVMRFWIKDQNICYKVYFNGALRNDYQYGKSYTFTDKTLENLEYSFYTEDKETKKQIAKNYPLTRKYDEKGRVIYERMITDKGKGQVRIVSKTLPDIQELASNFSTPIDLDNAIEWE